MKQIRIHIVLFMAFAMLAQSCGNKSGIPTLRETYYKKDNNPFGSSYAYKFLKKAYQGQTIETTKNDIVKINNLSYDTSALYISIGRKILLTNDEINNLLDYVYKGNIALITANDIDKKLLSRIGCTLEPDFLNVSNMFVHFKNTKSSLTSGVLAESDSSFEYFYRPFSNHFDSAYTPYFNQVGFNENGEPNFLVFFWGKGRMFLHCDPRAFSNYFLMTKNNYKYWQQILQIFPEKPENIIIDEYYTTKDYKEFDNKPSLISLLLKEPPLAWAFWIFISLAAIYILLNIKRRQRLIPVREPLQNSSVAFTEAVAGLYLKEKNNKVIADKMVTFFIDGVRRKYFLTSGVINQNFIVSLSKKSAIPLDQTQKLFSTITNINESQKVSNEQLLELNSQIQNFY